MSFAQYQTKIHYGWFVLVHCKQTRFKLVGINNPFNIQLLGRQPLHAI